MLPRWTRPDGETPDDTVTCLPSPACRMASSAARVTQSVGRRTCRETLPEERPSWRVSSTSVLRPARRAERVLRAQRGGRTEVIARRQRAERARGTDERRSRPLSPLRRSSTPPTQPRTEWAAGAEPPRGPDAGTSLPWSHCPVRATWLSDACGTNMPCMSRADRRGVRRAAGTVLTALGLTLEEERQYQQLLPLSGGPAADVATVLGTTEEALAGRLAPCSSAAWSAWRATDWSC